MRLFFLLLPWIELFSLIQLGVATSAFTALAYVFLTFIAGVFLLRLQGRGMLEKLRQAQAGRAFGPEMLVDDMAVGLAALLLMIPGLLTDTLALLVLFGPLRRRLVRLLTGASSVETPRSGQTQREWRDDATIEGDFRRVDDDEQK